MSNVWYYVTGTDSGFGKEAVARLADKKCNVFAGHFMKESAAMLSALGTTVVPVALDVTSDASVKSAAEAIEKRLAESGGSLGGLVNNAGLLFQNGPSEWTPVANWQKMYDVNVLGMVRVTNSVLPLLRKAEGRIVNTASIAGRTGLPTQTAYCASKWAVEGYSEALRREVHVWGITVHIVEPGVFLQTDLYKTYYDGLDKVCPPLVKVSLSSPVLQRRPDQNSSPEHDTGEPVRPYLLKLHRSACRCLSQ
ncbi:3 beta-hydroxysteroid dehydrogenase dhs-16 [Diplonema papillatum]|nr:3 beta-hydroxysteroid dehydrogenase dhs-16 [Diplonema papillatum]